MSPTNGFIPIPFECNPFVETNRDNSHVVMETCCMYFTHKITVNKSSSPLSI
jgi:hypothetical protein